MVNNSTDTEIKKVLVIETKSAVKSIEEVGQATEQTYKSMGEYKKYIDKLTASLIDLDEESDDYNRTLRLLRDSQEKYNKIIKDTKKENDALDGSYNYLVKRMGELKKAWKTTTDAVERDALGKQINEINNELKSLDSTIGNYQRNVGNYAQGFTQGFKELTDGLSLFIPNARLAGDAVEKITKTMIGGSSVVSSFKDYFASLFETVFPNISLFNKHKAVVKDNSKEILEASKATKKWQIAEATAEGVIGSTTLAVTQQGKKAAETAANVAKTTDAFNRLSEGALKTFEVLKKGPTNINELAKALGKSKYDVLHYLSELRNAGITTTDNLVKNVVELKTSTEITGKAIDGLSDSIVNTDKVTGKLTGKLSSLFDKGLEWISKILHTKLGFGVIATAITAATAALAYFITKSIESYKTLKAFDLELRNLKNSAAADILTFNELAESWTKLSEEDKVGWIEKNTNALEELGIAGKEVNEYDDIFIQNSSKYIEALQARAEAEGAFSLLVKKYQEFYEKRNELEQKLEEKEKAKRIQGGNIAAVYAFYPSDNAVEKLEKEYNKYAEKIIEIRKNALEKANSLLNIKVETAAVETEVVEEIKDIKENIDKDIERAKQIAQRAEDSLKESKQREIDILTRTYNTERELLISKNIDTYNLTEEYNKNLDIINKKYEDAELERIKNYEEEKRRIREEQYNSLSDIYAQRIFIADKTDLSPLKNVKILDINKERLENQKSWLEAQMRSNDLSIEEQIRYAKELNRIDAEIVDNKKQKTAALLSVTNSTIQDFGNAISSTFGALSRFYEEGTEEYKGFATAEATISMLMGVINTWTSVMSPVNSYLTIWGQIALGTTQSAAIIATGLANIKQIQSTTNNSNGSIISSSAGSFKPAYATSVGTTKTTLDENSVQNIGNTVTNAAKEQEIWVSVTDITKMQNKVKVVDKNRTF